MKRASLSLLGLCGLAIVNCGNPPVTPTPPSQTVNTQTQDLPAPTFKVFLENSGSMNGYVKGPTDFENAVYSFLSDIQLADLDWAQDSIIKTKNTLELNYINSAIIKQPSDIQAFIDALEPASFQMQGGNRGTSDIADILQSVVNETGSTDVSLFISDCIFSPGKKYKARDNADDYLVAQQIAIKNTFVQKVRQDSNFSVVVLRLLSNFDGNYYNKFDDKTHYIGIRPFYIWLMGNQLQLKRLLDKVDIGKIKGSGVQNVYIAFNMSSSIQYGILYGKGIGQFNPSKENPKTSISNAKAKKIGNEKKFQLAIGVDYSDLLLDDSYLIDSDNYTISNKAYSFEVLKNKDQASPYTHIIKLNLTQPIISKGAIKITLNKTQPAWIDELSDNVGLNINSEDSQNKTYGLNYLIEGVSEAYKEESFGVIKINIK